MREKIDVFIYVGVIVMFTFCSRESENNNKQSQTDSENANEIVIKNGNKETIISNDREHLGKILDLKTYKPIRVKYKYTFIDNSGKDKRITVPGPSDSYLEAILYFDSLTFRKFQEFDSNADYPSSNFNKDEFKFEWLDNGVLTELDNSESDYHGHPDFFFGTKHGKSWYLDKKILIKYSDY